jgi:hypothetical protein
VKTIFAILALIGAALAALTTSLGAADAHKRASGTAGELEALARAIEWRRDGVEIQPFVTDLDRILREAGGDRLTRNVAAVS